MKDNQLIITPISNQHLIEYAKMLPHQGALKLSADKLLYVDIDDRYIHKLCPLLNEPYVEKPDYFSIGIGSHISVIYPNELEVPKFNHGVLIDFEVNSLFSAETTDKIYFALTIHSPRLLEIRLKNKLPKKLNLNGYIVDLHTTIGIIRK